VWLWCTPATLFAIAALVIALSGGYYLERRARMLKVAHKESHALAEKEETFKSEGSPFFQGFSC
jgi:hypothetical protein